MLIQVNSDTNVTADTDLIAHVDASLREALRHRAEHITRIEVHFSDESGAGRPGPIDKRCSLEARIEGLQPIQVSHAAASIELSLSGASGKLKRSVDTVLGRRANHEPRHP